MNCNECLENLVAYLEGLLGPGQAQELLAHLKICESCRAECDAFSQLRERLIRCGKASEIRKRDKEL